MPLIPSYAHPCAPSALFGMAMNHLIMALYIITILLLVLYNVKL